MSEENEAANTTSSSCASCGVAEIDDVKLKECGDCDLVRYCSDGCRMEHKSKHNKACKKRAAELRDEQLFTQPESTHFGDCPICCLPMPLQQSKSTLQRCCSNFICNGCYHANQIREVKSSLILSCPFCREPTPATIEEGNKQLMKRVEAGDPVALCRQGIELYNEGDYNSAVEYYAKAAELGDAMAHFKLAAMHQLGRGVEEDEGKGMYHFEEAAIGGHPGARHLLAGKELQNGNIERAVKHWIISATQGLDESIKALMKAFKLMDAFQGGFVSKEVLAATLRAHHAAVDATKSPQREAAEKYKKY